MVSEQVMTLGFYFKFVYIRCIPTPEFFLGSQRLLYKASIYIRTICFKAKDKSFPGIILVETNGFTSELT